MKCGAPMDPKSKFCAKCGAPAADSKKIKITQNGRGGLTFDVPPGTTAEISGGPVKKERKTAERKTEQPKKKSGGPAKLIIAALAGLLGFTGFVEPGFFLKGGKPEGGNTVLPDTSGGNTAVPAELPEYSGSSKAFEKTVCDGVVVRAEENAFFKDTDVRMTPLDEIPDKYNSVKQELADQWMIPVSAWEVDAGLADDEIIPGVFEVEIDLDKLDLDPAFYPCLSVGRFGDDGSFYEYGTTVRDGRLIYQSRQNSVTAVLVCGAAIIYKGAQAMDYINESKYFWSRKDYLKRYVEIKKYQTDYGSYELQWITADIDPELGEKVNRIHEIEEDCREQAEEYEKTLDAAKELDRNKQKASYYKYLLESDDEYKQLRELVKIPQAVLDTRKYIDTAYKYLGGVANVRMPTGKVIFLARTDSHLPENRNKLGLAEKLNFSTIVSLWPLKALTDQESRDNYLLTITHELFHVCQERYRFTPPAADKLSDDPRFDEMVTMVLERDAKLYYQNNGIITTDPSLTDKVRWDTMRLPIDNEPDSRGTANGKDLKMREGYQLGDFVMYLQQEYRERYVTPHKLMKARSYFFQPGTSGPLTEAFEISETEFDLFFRKWLLARRGELTEKAVQNFNEGGYLPKDWIRLKSGDCAHVSLEKDGSYFLSLRGFMKNMKGELKGILIFDDDFRKNHHSVNLVPLVPDYVPIERGAYFSSITFLTIGEIYGKIEAGENMDVGYSVWTFDKTPSPALDQTDDSLIISLPKTSGAAKAGVIDGYVLKITAGDQVIIDDEIDKAGFEKSFSYAKSQLSKGGRTDLSVTLCEFVRSNDGKRCPGIESDPVRITIGEEKQADERVYKNLYLYKDKTCRFDGDIIAGYMERDDYTVGSWPGGNQVRITGNKIEVVLAAVDFTVTGSNLQYDVVSFNDNYTRQSVTFTGEFKGDYGENHLYYILTGVSPAVFSGSETESGTQRVGTYSGGQTTYTYRNYRFENSVAFSDPGTDGIIDVYFKNGDISSVEISLPGRYTFNDDYKTEGENPVSESSEGRYTYTLELLR